MEKIELPQTNLSEKIKYPIKIGNIFKLSFAEELGNAVSHGSMAVIMLLALPACAVYGYVKGGVTLSVGFSVFVISLLLMFLISCLYHSMPFGSKHKEVFRILDHSAIYITIAGTFTPTCLMMQGWLGKVVLICQWTVAIFGILYRSLSRKSVPRATVWVYLVMGWSAVLLMPEIIRAKRWVFLGLLSLGGILYSVGVIFYAKKDRGWFHFIWHLCIIGASISHFIAIIFFQS